MEISSREYKVGLKADRFGAAGASSLAAAAEFWLAAAHTFDAVRIAALGALEHQEPTKQRALHFLDTADLALFRRRGLVLRLRRPLAREDDWTATLKFRHGDRLIADAEEFRPRADGDVKFEEDIKLVPGRVKQSCWTLFSRSAQATVRSAKKLRTCGDCLSLFDSVGRANLPGERDAMSVVGDVRVLEHVYEGASIGLEDGVEAKCALILWWRESEPTAPIAAEFSFRFDLEDGETSAKTARNALHALSAIAANGVWADPAGATKTALIYE